MPECRSALILQYTCTALSTVLSTDQLISKSEQSWRGELEQEYCSSVQEGGLQNQHLNQEHKPD